ncbi:hypothetical protein F5144DRAFT_333954 [Chaetomium tenue]|uniref:Uncharacterized protein n=1 Tax=Chaetomium tenue TaxID=1854479 RepID=A0ACB7NWQ8_9PEZI|nr:hypothetical protein F5144DRAFT_333954 [Chaetomium globosum]
MQTRRLLWARAALINSHPLPTGTDTHFQPRFLERSQYKKHTGPHRLIRPTTSPVLAKTTLEPPPLLWIPCHTSHQTPATEFFLPDRRCSTRLAPKVYNSQPSPQHPIFRELVSGCHFFFSLSHFASRDPTRVHGPSHVPHPQYPFHFPATIRICLIHTQSSPTLPSPPEGRLCSAFYFSSCNQRNRLSARNLQRISTTW